MNYQEALDALKWGHVLTNSTAMGQSLTWNIGGYQIGKDLAHEVLPLCEFHRQHIGKVLSRTQYRLKGMVPSVIDGIRKTTPDPLTNEMAERSSLTSITVEEVIDHLMAGGSVTGVPYGRGKSQHKWFIDGQRMVSTSVNNAFGKLRKRPGLDTIVAPDGVKTVKIRGDAR